MDRDVITHFRTIATTVLISAILTACQSDSDSKGVNLDTELKNATTLENYLKRGYINQYSESTNASTEVDTAAPATDTDTSADDSTGGNYSVTNTQESGVDEADLVKQNGSYLYAVQQPLPAWLDPSGTTAPKILSWATHTNPVSSSLQGSVTLAGAYDVEGLYLQDNRLIALTRSGLDPSRNDLATTRASDSYYNPWYWQSYSTDVRVLDLSTPAQPNQNYQLSIEGYLISSRVINGQLYMATKFTPTISPPDNSKEYGDNVSIASWQHTVLDTPLSELLPRIWINGEQTGHLFEDGNCHVPDLAQGGYPSIVALVRINLNNPTDWEASCNSGRITGVYASTDAFIMTGYDNSHWDSTRLDWYTLDGLTLKASGTVPGTLDGSMPGFRLSEQDGNLRILTSSWNWWFWEDVLIDDVATLESSSSTTAVAANSTDLMESSDWQHRLFIVTPASDGTLDLISQLPNASRTTVIGKPGEDVKAVRYRGDRAYVVTFQQTDPLYVLNLSDASDPFVEGELEITGFSAYLHPLSDSLLLGIGQDADSSGRTAGLKLTLFNTSDAANPTAISSTRLGGRGSSADILQDHHAASFLATDSGVRLAFTWSHYDENNGYQWLGDKIYIADINTSTQTLTEILNTNYLEPNDESYANYWYSYQYTRVPLQADGLHLVNNGEVTSGSVTDWTAQ
tara:strand:+ start:1031 stop:3082 length:2052 start_codon:yes stop_codon:yes gene_type:complete